MEKGIQTFCNVAMTGVLNQNNRIYEESAFLEAMPEIKEFVVLRIPLVEGGFKERLVGFCEELLVGFKCRFGSRMEKITIFQKRVFKNYRKAEANDLLELEKLETHYDIREEIQKQIKKKMDRDLQQMMLPKFEGTTNDALNMFRYYGYGLVSHPAPETHIILPSGV